MYRPANNDVTRGYEHLGSRALETSDSSPSLVHAGGGSKSGQPLFLNVSIDAASIDWILDLLSESPERSLTSVTKPKLSVSCTPLLASARK
jgi:hypothetical protein